MARVGLDAAAVVAAAAAIADAEGLEELTLARLARTLGVRSPSLYAHVGGLEDLRERIGSLAASELGTALAGAAAGRARGDAVAAIAHAYRRYALAHPGRYAAMQRAVPDVDDAPRKALVDVVLAVLRGYGLSGEEAIHATRALRSALHGFCTLEAGGGFGIPLSLDESFERLVAIIERGLRSG